MTTPNNEREFVEYEAADGSSTIQAHIVTEETAGEVFTRVGSTQVGPGSVIIATDRPEVFDVLSEEQWNATGYSDAATAPDAPSDSDKSETVLDTDTQDDGK